MNNYTITGTHMIENFYQEEDQIACHEDQFTKVTLRMNVEDAALFTAIAERFDMSRMELLEPIFSRTANEMFQGLTSEDRKAIGSKADRLATEMLEKNGQKVETYSGANGAVDELCRWTIYADVCNTRDEEIMKGEK